MGKRKLRIKGILKTKEGTLKKDGVRDSIIIKNRPAREGEKAMGNRKIIGGGERLFNTKRVESFKFGRGSKRKPFKMLRKR